MGRAVFLESFDVGMTFDVEVSIVRGYSGIAGD